MRNEEGVPVLVATQSGAAGSLGLQSQSDDTGGHGGGEGGAWLLAGAATVGTQGHLQKGGGGGRVSGRSCWYVRDEQTHPPEDTLRGAQHRITH